MVGKGNGSFFYTTLLYIIGMILFLEWIYPLNEITETNDVTVFIIYTLICFFITLLQLSWWASFLLKGITLLFVLNTLFYSEPFIQIEWVQQLFNDLLINIQFLLSQQWYDLTDLFRHGLILLLIWLMSYLIYYWFVIMKQFFLFIVLTIIYLSLLDTFTDYAGIFPIIRIFTISFIALGLANLFKIVERESIHIRSFKKTLLWFIPLILIVLLSSTIGYVTPKYEPQWPDPVPFITGKIEDSKTESVRKAGYGEDDSQLGGPFIQDDTPVFQSTVMVEHYWRIESKDVYTGKGWVRSSDLNFQEQTSNNISLKTFTDHVETEKLKAMVDFENDPSIDLKKLIYPYGITQVSGGDRAEFLLDRQSGLIQTHMNNKKVNLPNYTIIYNNPSFNITELQEASENDPANISKQYTKLPKELPARVSELAEEITASEKNRYDKAKQIEQYFGRNGFVYQLSDIPVPEENQDYVDQFLFESKKGYCDNYSTSMVIMLRTLGIPARWVKGFTSGEKIKSDIEHEEGSFDLYQVTNANAHSWVEVYFPDIGWVPFEPTQGFSNLSDFNNSEDHHEEQDDVDQLTEGLEEPEEDELTADEEFENKESAEEKKAAVQWNWLVLFTVITLFLVGLIIYKTRFNWRTILMVRKLKRQKDEATSIQAYYYLIKLLGHKYMLKKPNQTLREYAKAVDRQYQSHEMGQLTTYFEHVLYNNERIEMNIDEFISLYRQIIKRIMA